MSLSSIHARDTNILVIDWCHLHGINPAITYRLAWDGETITASQYVKDEFGKLVWKDGALAVIDVIVPQKAPFPVKT